MVVFDILVTVIILFFAVFIPGMDERIDRYHDSKKSR